jgi:hypothetical protein
MNALWKGRRSRMMAGHVTHLIFWAFFFLGIFFSSRPKNGRDAKKRRLKKRKTKK